ncbi:MAG: hypothetical protein R3240_03570 [Gammaproteobacteria bacterium]|nr:hypothetical protein [Gammaproteobacteria bacterium]
MKYNKSIGWILSAGLAASLFTANAQSAVVFEETFDQSPPIALSTRGSTTTEWIKRQGTLRGKITTAQMGDGVLDITTTEQDYGGASTGRSDLYDFFNQELTYTFSGINLQPVGQSQPANQWAKFGVFASDGSLWYGGSMFLVGFNGKGRFTLQVKQPSLQTNTIESLYVKDFKVPYFNFDIADISKVKITLDDTYFRILFIFKNELDQISFGGEHGLDRDRWFVDSVYLWRAKAELDQAQIAYDDAVASGDQARIDAALAALQAAQDAYDAKYAEADPLKGDTSVFISASSTDATYLRSSNLEAGANLKIDTLRVETTNVLDVLRNPPAP